MYIHVYTYLESKIVVAKVTIINNGRVEPLGEQDESMKLFRYQLFYKYIYTCI